MSEEKRTVDEEVEKTVEDLKKQADHVTDSNARDGAAKAVEWILKR